MKPKLPGVATYLQTFILIAVALAGTAVAYSTVQGYATAGGGPAIRIWDASLRQDAGLAVERFAVSDSGTSEFPYFIALNPGLDRNVTYCYTVSSSTGEELIKTCPVMEADPTSIKIMSNLTSGRTVVVMVMLAADGVVSPGGVYTLLVSAPGAAVASEQVVAV